jgi:hypothetical protein
MARNVVVPERSVIEEITGIQVNSDCIRFMVGKCGEDGEFVVPQQFETFTLDTSIYQDFITAHPTGFVKDDLWEYVDILRLSADSIRPSRHHTWDGVTLAWVEPIDYIDLIKKDAIDGVNSSAGKKILDRYPQYKQANMTARFIELMTLSETSSQEALDIKAAWDWIKSIRQESNVASDVITAADAAGQVSAAVDAFNVAIAGLA